MPGSGSVMHTFSPSQKAPLWLLVLVTIAGTTAMHIFTPALLDAGRHLDASTAQMQQTITVYIFGLAIGQLIYGPLSDSLGRRPMLLIGLSIYTLASILAALAPNASVLISARLMQALGGCAGLALGRAIARDTSTPETVVGNLALLNLMVMMGPGIAPFIGSVLDHELGWRAIFVLLALSGLVTIMSTWKLLPETGKPSGQLHWGKVQRDYRQLLSMPSFTCYAVGGGCCTTSMYAFIAAAPFILMHMLGTTQTELGMYLGLMMLGMAVGNWLARLLIRRTAVERILHYGNSLSLCCAAVLIALTLAEQLSTPAVIGLMVLYTVGAGLTAPAALSKALGVPSHLTGSAAGVYGFTQMTVGALCTLGASLTSNHALSAFGVLLAASLLGQWCFRTGARYKAA